MGKDSLKYRSECEQCIIKKGHEWRNNNCEEAKSYSREYFRKIKEKLLKKQKSDVMRIQTVNNPQLKESNLYNAKR